MKEGSTTPCNHCGRPMRVRRSPKTGALVAKCDECPVQVLLFTKLHLADQCPRCQGVQAPIAPVAAAPVEAQKRRSEL